MKTRLMASSALIAIGLALAACGEDAPKSEGPEQITSPSPFHGIHGITVDNEGRVLAGSVLGSAIYEVDPASGETSIFIAPPLGMADDLEQGPDGSLAWTAFQDGKVYVRQPDGKDFTVASGLPGMNSIAWTEDGRLFATQVFLGDALYELDPKGAQPPREIMRDMGGLNGFDFGPDGKLYGPIWFKGQVARVDVDEGTLEVVADGFGIPAAANFNSKGELYVVDTKRGHVYLVDTETGEKTLKAEVKPAIDNLAFAPDDTLYITNMADNAVIRIDPETGGATTLVSGPLAATGDMVLSERDGKPALIVSDVFAIRAVDPETGGTSDIARVFGNDIHYPIGISAADGKLIASSWNEGVVQLLDADTADSIELMRGFTTPMDAVLLANGDLIVSEYLRGALVRAPAENREDRSDVASGLSGPANLWLKDEETVLVAESAEGRITEIDLGSGETRVLVERLDQPEGFALTADGKLLVAEVGRDRLILCDPETGAKAPVASGLPIGFKGSSRGPAVNLPTGVVVLDDDTAYFTSDEKVGVYRVPATLLKQAREKLKAASAPPGSPTPGSDPQDSEPTGPGAAEAPASPS